MPFLRVVLVDIGIPVVDIIWAITDNHGFRIRFETQIRGFTHWLILCPWLILCLLLELSLPLNMAKIKKFSIVKRVCHDDWEGGSISQLRWPEAGMIRSWLQNIVAVTTKRQTIFPFSEITIQNNGNKPSFGRENREIWRSVVTATIYL